MAGYIRQSTYTDGDIIQASDSNDEFDQLVAAFHNSTGHSHDGTAGEGSVIGLIGDPGVVTPLNKIQVDDTNNRIGVYMDVSGATVEQLRFQDGVIVPVTDNDIDLGTSSTKFKNGYFAGDLTVDGDINLGGNITIGDADTDSITVNADVDSNLIPNTDNAYDLGSASKEWRNLYIDGTANIDSLVADTADINAGTIDGTTIGATTASSGAFTTITASGNVTLNGNTTLGNAATDTVTVTADVASNLTPSADDTYSLGAVGSEWQNLYIDGTAYIDNLTIGTSTGITSVDTDLTSVSASDDTLASAKAIKAYVDSQVTAQDLDFQADSGGALSIDLDSETLTITGGTGLTTTGLGNTVTVDIDSTVATLTGTQTLTNKTLTSPDINGGTVDNAVIGGTTPAAITGTTITGTSFVGPLTGNVTGTVSSLSNHDTGDLSEGTNLYYTQARFDTAFGNKSTTNLTEGTNLYYTTARANTAIDARVDKTFVDNLNVDAQTVDGATKAELQGDGGIAMAIALG